MLGAGVAAVAKLTGVPMVVAAYRPSSLIESGVAPIRHAGARNQALRDIRAVTRAAWV
jgi:hypothetical protein